MTDPWAAIVATAGKALVYKVPGQLEINRYAYDRALRIVRTLEKLVAAMKPAIRPRRVDLVKIAALYACVGTGSGKRTERSDEIADDAAELAADHLQGKIPPADIDLTLRILRQSRTKNPELPEARLLADAASLEDVGLVGLWNQTRAAHAAGKTLDQLVKLWKTQQEYGYWETRLNDSFHFDVAVQTARRRLAQMDAIYEQMTHENQAEDIA